jgi:hypothetical protein
VVAGSKTSKLSFGSLGAGTPTPKIPSSTLIRRYFSYFLENVNVIFPKRFISMPKSGFASRIKGKAKPKGTSPH